MSTDQGRVRSLHLHLPLLMRMVDAFISSPLYRYQRYYLCLTYHPGCSATYANETGDASYGSIRAHLQKIAKGSSIIQTR